MAGAGRGKEKASLNPYFAGGGEERGGSGGEGDILRSNCHFSQFFFLFFFFKPPLLAPFLLQAPAPSNRTDRYEVPLGGRSHPSQLGRVALDRGQSHHQRFQYDRESWYWDVHPVRHIQWLGVRCMIRRRKKKQKQNNSNNKNNTQKQTKREIFTGKMDLRGRKKDLWNIADEKRTDWYKY